MKKYIAVILILFLLSASGVQATGFSSFLPGGKNYIDEANMTLSGEILSTNDPIRVKPNTTYVFWIPPDSVVTDPWITIEANGHLFINGRPGDYTSCNTTTSASYCTFNTLQYEYIELTVESADWQQFLNFYGFGDIQLEEGTTPTLYEEYIAPATDVTNPEFQGSAMFVKSYTETISIATIIDQYIIAYDDIDGDVTNSIITVEDEYTDNMNTVGEYNVVLQAQDSSGNTATFNLTIIVQDLIEPTIEGPLAIDISVDEQLSITEIINANFTFIDEHDGVITPTIILDYYTGNETVLGSYIVKIGAEDASGNVTSKTFSISVIDTTAPTVDSTTLTTTASADTPLETLIGNLLISDNYDGSSELTVVVESNTYEGNESIVGTYAATIMVNDLSGNQIVETISIIVLDDIAPVITGNNLIVGSYVSPPSISDIIDTLNIVDNVTSFTAEDVTIVVDNYSSRITAVGDYDVTIEVQDEAQNTTSFTFTVRLIDDIAPNIFVDNFLITVTPQALFQPRDALQTLIKNNALPNQLYTIDVIKDEYSGHEQKVGVYDYSVTFTGEDGISYHKDFQIKVYDNSTESVWNIIRPIGLYSLTFSFALFVLYKSKK